MPDKHSISSSQPSEEFKRKSSSADQDVVDGNMNEFDNETDDTHYHETNTNGLRDLNELPLIGLGASVDEKSSFFEEFSGNFSDLSELVRHCAAKSMSGSLK
uniref:Uncharacterized protein n=1 Tax=Medicago truncatula TaxID=3880 RepID=I3SMH7_MEDTR|nr:unknown [Medicago truncatula]